MSPTVENFVAFLIFVAVVIVIPPAEATKLSEGDSDILDNHFRNG
jgi:hypothetical protein